MQLPFETKIGLQPHYAPGETVASKPKQAMVLRMSTDALSALQQNPSDLNMQFGDSPGLYISDVFYSMRPLKEDTRHELYLRAASIKKPNAPLKLYATVQGKFTVERQLGDGIEDKIREVTKEANKQRHERQTKYLDTPPDLTTTKSTTKKRESTSMFRKPPRPTPIPQPKNTLAVPSASSSRARSPAGTTIERSPSTTALSSDLRTRILHCLAVKNRTLDTLIKAVGAPRADVVRILDQAAEPAPTLKKDSAAPIQYTLLAHSWLDIRPWEWPRLSENDRLVMARSGRTILRNLKIPEKDRIWDHFRYRSPNPVGTSAPVAPPEKRGVSSRDIKDKKTKAKAKAKTEPKEINIKEEGVRQSSTNETSSSAPSRRTPGSGYRLSKPGPSMSPNAHSESRSSPVPQSIKSTSTHRPDIPKSHSIATKPVKKIIPDDVPADTDGLRGNSVIKSRSSQKRPDREEDDVKESASKRRRTHEARSSATQPVRDLSLPKKPDVPLPRAQVPNLAVTEPMRRFKKEASPPTIPSAQQKQRPKIRREATYTSSEDDENAPVINTKAGSSSATPESNASVEDSSLPSSRADLRALYHSEYIRSLRLMSTLMTQRAVVEEKLKAEEYGSGSESDRELMDFDSLSSLSGEYRACQGQLQRIRARFEPTPMDVA